MSRAALPEILETARLRLRPWRFADVDDVLAYAADAQWARYLPVPQPYLRRHAVEFLARQVLLDFFVHPSWAIVLGDRVIGGINARFYFPRLAGAVGWSIARPVWGRGLATEAARAVVAAAFATHADLNRIEAMADTRNVASMRVMEKIGMQREGILRQNRFVRDEVVDAACYAILRREWEELSPL